jgi:hypothetical protein
VNHDIGRRQRADGAQGQQISGAGASANQEDATRLGVKIHAPPCRIARQGERKAFFAAA